MEFGLPGAILLASSSQTTPRAGRRLAANRSATRFELSRHVELALISLCRSETWSATSSRAGRRPASEQDSAS